QVTRGATTVWERWDAIRPDGSIHPGTMTPIPGESGDDGAHMLSFNHYAYGAVVDWIYRTVAGLTPDITSPGYRRVIIGATGRLSSGTLVMTTRPHREGIEAVHAPAMRLAEVAQRLAISRAAAY